jgi:ABC-2 type transport system ATP-binding protein
VEHLCEDVAIIDEGRIVLSGNLHEIKQAAGYRRVHIEVDDVLWTPPVRGAYKVGFGSRKHHIVDASIDVEQLLRLASADGSITRFSYEVPALSDIFHEAVAP